jgi:hypothetical protein
MKKIVFFISLIVITIAAPAQTAAPDQPISETERIVDKYLDRAEDAISALAEKLSVPAEHVYSVLVKQQVIKSVSTLFLIVFLIIISILAIWLPYKDWEKSNMRYAAGHDRDEGYRRWDLDDRWWLWSMIPGSIVLISSIIALVSCAELIATGLLNPEYGAIKTILSVMQ